MDPETQALAQWISANKNNADIVGKPEWVDKTSRYRELRQGSGATAPATAPPAEATPSAPAGVSTGGAILDQVGAGMNLGSGDGRTGLQLIKDWYSGAPAPAAPAPVDTSIPDVRSLRAKESPNSLGNLGDRAMTTVLTAIPDTGIGLVNAAGILAGRKEPILDYLAPQMREMAGGKEMPADAPWWQRYAEGTAAAVLSGGPRALLPAATGIAGSDIGQAVGGEKGAVLGGLLGGFVPRLTANAARYGVTKAYEGAGRPDAAEILRQSTRAGLDNADQFRPSRRIFQPAPKERRITPGMLGNKDIQNLEASLERKSGGQSVIDARNQVRQNMTNSAMEVPDAAGSTMSNPTVIAERARAGATDALAEATRRSDIAHENLRTVLGRTEAPVGNIPQAGNAMRLAAPARDAMDFRLDMLDRDVTRPALPDRPTVPADILLQNRTNLGRSFEQGKYPPATTQLYGPTTDSLRTAAASQGMSGRQFDRANAPMRAVEGPGGLRERLSEIIDREPSAISSYLQGGEQNPQRLTNFRQAMTEARGPAGTAQVGNIYGSHLRNLIEDTLNHRGGDAMGPINYAERIQSASPTGLRELAGGLPGAQRLRDVATAAGAFHRPTQQGNTGRMVGDVVSDAVGKAVGAGVGAAVGGSKVGQLASAAAGFLGPRYLNNVAPDQQRAHGHHAERSGAGRHGRTADTVPPACRYQRPQSRTDGDARLADLSKRTGAVAWPTWTTRRWSASSPGRSCWRARHRCWVRTRRPRSTR